jgi:hypothetical protein
LACKRWLRRGRVWIPAQGSIEKVPKDRPRGPILLQGKMLEVNKKGITPQSNAGTFYPGSNDQASLLQVDFIDEVR